eukprot:TRINITY_DN5366_c1_g1_i2.p1 TRINITY_DN5366_c1_g1~~TRINITY_DN5366_c1_g1_i2.p1  ORF type:complete len:703 (-),score=141.35 TRINITY_DN5366_c1_g1_i2:17-2125(-)
MLRATFLFVRPVTAKYLGRVFIASDLKSELHQLSRLRTRKTEQRETLEDIGKKLNVNKWQDWYQVKQRHVEKLGGAKVLKTYDRSLSSALVSLFPEHKWNILAFASNESKPTGSSVSEVTLSTLRSFFATVASQADVKDFRDWYKVHRASFASHDRNRTSVLSLLQGRATTYFDALVIALPEHPWQRWRFIDDKDHFQNDDNVRHFLQELKRHKNLQMDDFYGLSPQEVENFGGGELLRRNNFSLAAPLMKVFPEHNWTLWKFTFLPQNVWSSLKNQQTFLDYVGDNLGFSAAKDWYNITADDIVRFGGQGLLNLHKSPWEAVMNVFRAKHKWKSWKFEAFKEEKRRDRGEFLAPLDFRSEVTWEESEVINPRLLDRNAASDSFWSSPKSRRSFLDNFAADRAINSFEDWYSVRSVDFEVSGGTHLLRMFGNSAIKMLTSVYPEHTWEIFKFKHVLQSEHFDDLAVHAAFFHQIEKELSVASPEDWYHVSPSDLTSSSYGSRIMQKHYDNSVANVAAFRYPNSNFKLWKFIYPVGYWNDQSKQRRLFDQIAVELNVQRWEDWYHVEARDIAKFGGGSVLNSFYDSSPAKALASMYPEHDWKLWNFRKVPGGYWATEKNVTLAADWLSSQLGIKHLDDWYAVSLPQLQALGVSNMVAKRGGLVPFLRWRYPHHEWNEKHRVPDRKSLTQHVLYNALSQVLPSK